MAISLISAFLKKVADLPDTPSANMTTEELKNWFDAAPEELRNKLNDVINVVNGASMKTDFSNLLAVNGYQKLTNGLILQWGYYVPNQSATTSEKITLPIAFPNNFHGVFGTFSAQDVNTNAKQVRSYIDKYGTSKSQFVLRLQDVETNITSRWCYWWAIGN